MEGAMQNFKILRLFQEYDLPVNVTILNTTGLAYLT